MLTNRNVNKKFLSDWSDRPDIRQIGEPPQVMRHCVEIDEKTTEEKNWNGRNWTEKHGGLQNETKENGIEKE